MGLWPFPDCLDLPLVLPLVHLDTFRGDDVAEELDCGLVELTLFKLQVKVVLPESLEDLCAVVAMFGQVPGVD